MGWKVFYSASQDLFRDLYERAERWGELITYKATVEGRDYYGAGLVTSPPPGTYAFLMGPKISHPLGYKTKIAIKFMFWAGAGTPAGASSSIYISFYTDDQTAKSSEGYDLFGASITIQTPPGENYVSFYKMVVEQENNRIAWYVDGTKLGEATLQGPLQSFRLAVKVVSPGSPAHGIIIYEVVGEYFDWLEDVFNMMFNMMFMMMFIMVAVMFIRMIVSAVRPKKKEEVG